MIKRESGGLERVGEILKDGLFEEMKLRAFYEKPSVKRKQTEARRKRRKALARRARSTGD